MAGKISTKCHAFFGFATVSSDPEIHYFFSGAISIFRK